jgi:hydrogenase maturation protease
LSRLLLAVGNPGRGDDGLGHALALRVEAQIAAGELPGLAVEHRYQLNVEDAELLGRYDEVWVADAALDATAPAALREIAPAATLPFTTHGLGLPELLALAASLYGELPPVRLLAMRGAAFEIGEGLSAQAEQSLEAALALVDSGFVVE